MRLKGVLLTLSNAKIKFWICPNPINLKSRQKKARCDAPGCLVGPEFPPPDVFDQPLTSLSKRLAVLRFEKSEY